jgi:O-antigen/teichoic acid export membrane protein
MALFNSKYFLNARTVKLSIGNVISQVIPFLLMPILTRLYSPTEFGGLAIFVSLTLVLSECVTGKYELAILLPKKEEKAIELAQATIFFNFLSSFFLLLIIFLLKNPILKILDIEQSVGNWIYFLPIVIFFNGLYEIYKDYSLRVQEYNRITKSFIERAISTNISQLIFGIIRFTSNGLILGKIVSSLISNIEVAIVYFKQKNKYLLKKFNYKDSIRLLKEYRDFPAYSMPSSVLTTFSFQLILISIPILFTNSIAGYYLLAQRILNIPTSIIGNSMRQVYFKDFSEIGKDIKTLQQKAWELFKKLLIIGAFPTCIIISAGPFLFSLCFGQEWAIAGKYAQILSYWYLLIFITGPISALLIVLRKQKQALIFQSISIALKAGLIIICYILKFSIEKTLISFSILSSLLLLTYLLYIFSLVKLNFKKVAMFLLTFFLAFIIFTYGFKFSIDHFIIPLF